MLDWLESSAIARIVQESIWGYPIVLSAHAVGMAILVALRATSRIVCTVEYRGVALLASGGRSTLAAKPLQKPSEHVLVLPGRRYTYASRRIRLVA